MVVRVSQGGTGSRYVLRVLPHDFSAGGAKTCSIPAKFMSKRTHYFGLTSIAIRSGSGRLGKLFEWNGKMACVTVREDAGGHDLYAGAVERVEYALPKQ
jgi:hypothetical protein